MAGYRWGRRSLEILEDVHPNLVLVVTRGLHYMDLAVQQYGGYRTPTIQGVLFDEKKSKKDGIIKLSRHQSRPSEAVDLAPYPINWKDPRRWYYMGGLIRAIGEEMGIPVRWLGDMDSDGEILDQQFFDLGHFELVL